MKQTTFQKGTRVRATETKNEVNAGDEGEVVAGWARVNVAVRWDKDGGLRRFNKKRLEII